MRRTTRTKITIRRYALSQSVQSGQIVLFCEQCGRETDHRPPPGSTGSTEKTERVASGSVESGRLRACETECGDLMMCEPSADIQ